MERFIKGAIDSVIRQTYNNWELVILDDVSRDCSYQYAKEYAKKDERIKIYRNKVNKGTVYCQSEIIKLAKADIVGILDSDDMLKDNALEIVLSVFRGKPNVGFVYSKCMKIDENGNELGVGSNSRVPKNETVLRLQYDRVNHFKAFRKNVFNKTEGYSMDMKYTEDADIVIKLEEVTDFYFIDEILYFYRQHDESQFSGNVKNRIINHANHAQAKYRAFLRRQGTNIPNLNSLEISNEMYRGLTNALLLNDWEKSFYFFSKAFCLCPYNIMGLMKFFPRFLKYKIYGYPK